MTKYVLLFGKLKFFEANKFLRKTTKQQVIYLFIVKYM